MCVLPFLVGFFAFMPKKKGMEGRVMSNELMEKVDIEALLLLAEEKKYRLLLNALLEQD